MTFLPGDVLIWNSHTLLSIIFIVPYYIATDCPLLMRFILVLTTAVVLHILCRCGRVFCRVTVGRGAHQWENIKKLDWKRPLSPGWHVSPNCVFWPWILGREYLPVSRKTGSVPAADNKGLLSFFTVLDKMQEFRGSQWPIIKCFYGIHNFEEFVSKNHPP